MFNLIYSKAVPPKDDWSVGKKKVRQQDVNGSKNPPYAKILKKAGISFSNVA